MRERKIEKYLIKSPKQMIMVIALFTLMIFVGGTTYAFFNYNRTGSANTIKTGRIYFSTEQTNANTINLTNIFPMTKEQALADSSTNGQLVVTFTGDTTYTDGIEYLLTLENVTRDANIPISLIMDVNVESRTTGETPTTTTIAENANYYTARNDKTTSMYLASGEDTTINSTTHKVITDIKNGQYLLAGYIKSGTDVVNGTVTIKAFIDADNIIITDTPDDQSGNPPTGSTDGTDTTGKTVISTTDWNSLKANGVTFKVKGEAREGIWIEQKGTALGIIKQNVITPATPINFGEISSDTNGKGVYILPGTETDTNPIYYYRGAVTNNNVIFGGFCWLMVRTTETGGIKMIYNGVATDNGTTCTNATGTARQISTSAFNLNYSSMSDVGYMYNQRYAVTSGEPTSGVYFGTEAEYDDVNDVYNLKAGTTSTTLDATHHYTCNLTNASGTCSSIRYYYNKDVSNSYFYITLTDGDFIEDALYKMTGNGSSEVKARNSGYKLNTTSSTAKTNIENWFKTNLTNEVDTSKRNYQEYLEDTTWCNDRSYSTITGKGTYAESGWNPNGGSLTTYQYFAAGGRNINNHYSTTNVPIISCPNITDQFRVGNQEAKLNYPVGLLTSDEIIMAGTAGNSSATKYSTYYLYNGTTYYWSLSPNNFNNNNAFELDVDYGIINNHYVRNANGLRPSVSLKPGTEFVDGGEGTTTNPYVVKYTS